MVADEGPSHGIPAGTSTAAGQLGADSEHPHHPQGVSDGAPPPSARVPDRHPHHPQGEEDQVPAEGCCPVSPARCRWPNGSRWFADGRSRAPSGGPLPRPFRGPFSRHSGAPGVWVRVIARQGRCTPASSEPRLYGCLCMTAVRASSRRCPGRAASAASGPHWPTADWPSPRLPDRQPSGRRRPSGRPWTPSGPGCGWMSWLAGPDRPRRWQE